MNGKFIIYALLVSLFSTMATWGKFVGSSGGMRSGSGSSWYSNSGGGGSWGSGSGGHK